MNKVLNKRILRDLKENFLRYFALFLLIVMGMYIIVAMIASAETIIQGTEENAEINHLEDGQFAVFAELTASQEKEIPNCRGGKRKEHLVSYQKFPFRPP